MNLNQNDINLFYKLWLGILQYTNQKYNVVPELEIMKTAKSLNPTELVPIRDFLWENTEIIDEFIQYNPYFFQQSDLEILSGWKRRITGKFILVKHLKYYSVFMSSDDGGKVYAVTGITDSISAMFDSSRLPLLVTAALIPFKGRIIYDSLFIPYNIDIGRNMRRGLNQEYREIKAKRGIITKI